MALLDDVKNVLRESGAQSNTEIQDLIDAAKLDLEISGVAPANILETDKLIKRAINLYCKAHFSYEDPKTAERFADEYVNLKKHLVMSSKYTEVPE